MIDVLKLYADWCNLCKKYSPILGKWVEDNGFKPSDAEYIPTLLAMYDDRLKGTSFLPAIDGGVYKHMPYEEISPGKFDDMCVYIGRPSFGVAYANGEDAKSDKFCSSDVCEIAEEINSSDGITVRLVDIASL